MFANFTCPECRAEEKIEVPQDRCLIIYKCKKCNRLITTPKGSCCIVCSYTDRRCPVSKEVVK